jgi:hypothetical protein
MNPIEKRWSCEYTDNQLSQYGGDTYALAQPACALGRKKQPGYQDE